MTMKAKIEKYTPIILSVIVLCVLLYMEFNLAVDVRKTISNELITMFSIFFGFISSSLSILCSMQDKDFIKGMKTTGAYSEIIEYHWKAIFASSISIVIAFFSTLSCDWYFLTDFIDEILLSVSIGAFASILRVVYLFKQTLSFS